MNLDEWEKQSADELAVAEADLQAAQERVNELRTIREGIRLAKQRYGQQDQATPPVTQSRSVKATSSAGRKVRRKAARRPQPSHSELCHDLVVEFGGQASSAAAREVLRERGHDLDPDQVRNAFAYLVRKGQVERVEAGVWKLVTPTENASQTPVVTDHDPQIVPQPSM